MNWRLVNNCRECPFGSDGMCRHPESDYGDLTPGQERGREPAPGGCPLRFSPFVGVSYSMGGPLVCWRLRLSDGADFDIEPLRDVVREMFREVTG